MSRLKGILARLSAGAPSSITLPHGLYLRTERDGAAILLHVARKGAEKPSAKELATLIAHWPAAPALPIAPVARETSQMTGYSLRVEFPRPTFGQVPARVTFFVQCCPVCKLVQAHDYNCSGCGAPLPESIQITGDEPEYG